VDDMYQYLSLGAGTTGEPTYLGMMDVLIAGAGAFVAVNCCGPRRQVQKTNIQRYQQIHHHLTQACHP